MHSLLSCQIVKQSNSDFVSFLTENSRATAARVPQNSMRVDKWIDLADLRMKHIYNQVR